jgi:ABC-type multidrug transport system fused ATPase/permease subunit
VVPSALISLATIIITLGALALLGPLLAFPCLIAIPILWVAARWYLKRARDGYLRQSLSYSHIMGSLTETVDGARTVEALSIAHRRVARGDRDISETYAAERYTLRLRTVFLPISDVTYVLPVVATLIVGGIFYIDGLVTLAAVTAATLYVQQVLGPVDMFLSHMDELQAGGASLARLLGVASPKKQDAADSGAAPVHSDIVVRGVSYAYLEGRDVLHDINLDIRQGERLAIVGPSGAGKSTLGRLLAGIDVPRTGEITIGGMRQADLPLPVLRSHIALVTQEYHMFGGSIRDNLAIAKLDASDEELKAALRAVAAWEWAAAIGLDTLVGSGGTYLSSAQIQQLSLARLVLADPHILVLDEATSLLDPRGARDLERSLAAVLEGRTVIAIAHRLHTAHDADRVAVMEDGRITELGCHDDLLCRGGAYASLWTSWHGNSEGMNLLEPAA